MYHEHSLFSIVRQNIIKMTLVITPVSNNVNAKPNGLRSTTRSLNPKLQRRALLNQRRI